MKPKSEETTIRDTRSLKTIAHRGSHTDLPENTIATFKAAISKHADSFECDVRFSKDGKPIIFHDRTILNMTGLPIPVRHLKSKHLKMLAGQHRQIPLLEEVLGLLQESSIHCYLDLKISNPDQVLQVVKMVKQTETLAKVTFMLKWKQYRHARAFLSQQYDANVAMWAPYPFRQLESCLRDFEGNDVALFVVFPLVHVDRWLHIKRLSRAIRTVISLGLKVTSGFANDQHSIHYLLTQHIDGMWTSKLTFMQGVLDNHHIRLRRPLRKARSFAIRRET